MDSNAVLVLIKYGVVFLLCRRPQMVERLGPLNLLKTILFTLMALVWPFSYPLRQMSCSILRFLNPISDCVTETHCCAVGESADLPDAGAYIYCTFDGNTWVRTFNISQTKTTGKEWSMAQRNHHCLAQNFSAYSLLEIRFMNATLGWAVGGQLDVVEPKAWFVETKDGGKSWNPQAHVLPGYYAMALNVVGTQVAYAAIDNVVTQTSGVAKWTP